MKKKLSFFLILSVVLVSCTVQPHVAATATIVSQEKIYVEYREFIHSITWEQLLDPESPVFDEIRSQFADVYLFATGTQNYTREEIIGAIHFVWDRETFTEIWLSYDFPIEDLGDQSGFAVKEPGEPGYMYIDISQIRTNVLSTPETSTERAGVPIMLITMHEMLHLDTVRNTEGVQIMNPEVTVPVDGVEEQILWFEGGRVHTQNAILLFRFDEVWVESLTIQFVLEVLDFGVFRTNPAYYEVGVDLFLPYMTEFIEMPWHESYRLHATSDLEAMAIRLGEPLPREGGALEKGMFLFQGFHLADITLLQSVGLCDIHECP